MSQRQVSHHGFRRSNCANSHTVSPVQRRPIRQQKHGVQQSVTPQRRVHHGQRNGQQRRTIRRTCSRRLPSSQPLAAIPDLITTKANTTDDDRNDTQRVDLALKTTSEALRL